MKEMEFKVSKQDENFTVSMGLSRQSNGRYLHDLKKEANFAKSKAKESGKNRLELY